MLTVSIVIPTYNRAHLITRALRSILGQISDGDEIIVIDDGSTDNTEQVLAPFLDKIRYIKIPNSGAGAARNRGIREARCDLVAFLDSDDEWMPHKLEIQKNVMQAFPEVLYIMSDFAITDIHGKPERRYLREWHGDPRSWDEMLGPGVPYSGVAALPDGYSDFKIHIGSMYLLSMLSFFISTDTLLVRREAAGDSLHYAEDLPLFEDWECEAHLSKKGLAAFIDIETAWQHGHTGSRLTDADRQVRWTTRIKIMERIWGTDQEFLREHGEDYKRVLSEQRLMLIKDLIFHGNLIEAQRELKLLDNAPLFIKALALLPQPVVKEALRLRRIFRSKLN